MSVQKPSCRIAPWEPVFRKSEGYEASERTWGTMGLGPSCVTVSQALWMNLSPFSWRSYAQVCPCVCVRVFVCVYPQH